MKLLTGDASTIPGHTSMPFDVGKAVSIVHYLSARGDDYVYDGKAVDFTAPMDENFAFQKNGQIVNGCDCSGLQRVLDYRCSGAELNNIDIGDGSVGQNEWHVNNGFLYHDILEPNSDTYLWGMDQKYVYQAYCQTGARGEQIGHTWKCVWINKSWWTLESCGGHGPTMRPYDTPVLARIVTRIFPVALNTMTL